MTEERKRPVLRDPRVPKFPVIFAKPTFEQIKDNFSTTDYTQWAGMGASCFPMGYIIGAFTPMAYDTLCHWKEIAI